MASTSSLTFADLLRFHRTAAGLTQEELAARARLSVDAISTLERGTRRTPRKDTVALLADALDLSPEGREVFVAAARRPSISAQAATPSEDTQPAARTSATETSATHQLRGVLTASWPATPATFAVVVVLSLALLTIAGVLLSLVVSTFPWVVALVAGAVMLPLLVAAILVRPLRQEMLSQWCAARKPFVAVASVALTLLAVLTTQFVTAPAPLAQSQRAVYDFSYTYHRPTHVGGSITVGFPEQLETLATDWVGDGGQPFSNLFLWQTCVVQLPDQTLGLKGWKADQCTEVPTVDNSGESSDAKTTTFHIDPRAVWSDGAPLTADDFLFGQRLSADPNLNYFGYFRSMSLIKVDAHTVRIQWDKPTPDYLTTLSHLYPAPLHVYATGKFADVYNPATGSYNSALAQQLVKTPAFNTTIPVDNGPFTVQSFVPDHQVVLVRNPRFFSHYFHSPALDKITLFTVAQDFLPEFAANLHPLPQLETDLIDRYLQGTLDLVVPLEPINLRQLGEIPKSQVQIASASDTVEIGFNQRTVAPNAHANGDVSIFTDRSVRQAFVEAFDRCTAVRALLGGVKCNDPNIFTDESDATAAVAAFDPSFRLPAYNPTDAAHLMEAAGYHLVDGVRRNRDGVTPLTLKLVVSPGATSSVALAQRMQQDYRRNLKVGVIVEVSQFAFWKSQSPFQTGAFDLFLDRSDNTVNPILRLTHDDVGPFDNATIEAGGNPFGIIDAQATLRDQLAAQTISDEQRAVILLNLHRYFSQQYYFDPMYISAIIALKKPTLCNFKLWPDPWASLWNIADWYVAPSCP
ncbi:MAG TPA: ABC transporter substrate-binding protein [Ktedonobacterales bacterium]|jgi:ABC-type transport system substrate-binding protein/transcriptional regulator with XRE-family HTH domain